MRVYKLHHQMFFIVIWSNQPLIRPLFLQRRVSSLEEDTFILKSGLIRELALWSGGTGSQLWLNVAIWSKMEKIFFRPKQKQILRLDLYSEKYSAVNNFPSINYNIQYIFLKYQINIITFIVNMTLKSFNIYHVIQRCKCMMTSLIIG